MPPKGMGSIWSCFALALLIAAIQAQHNPPAPVGGSHLKVHLVAGTHDDVGWLLTPEEYYEQQVRNILDSTVAALKDCPWRKFMYVEIYFFHRWWNDPRTTDIQREDLRNLIAKGQWEFVEGGWVMPDEATTTYSAVMDELTEGHLFLNATFGVIPRIGYQIDPFGASSAIAEHYRLAGFKYHIIDRINYKVKENMKSTQSLEFRWSPSASSSDSIFTHVLDEIYCSPMDDGFNFEGDVTNNPPVTNGNIKERATQYALEIRKRQPVWKTPTMLMLHQCDFRYQKASLQFDNMDKIIKYITDNPTLFNITIQWSLLSDYFKDIEANYPLETFPTRDAQDFFPYDDNDDSWWTGYYTSRPELKGLVRAAEAELRTVDTLSAWMAAKYTTYPGMPSSIENLHQALAVAQHHDAVAGTERQAVAENYAALLWRARAETTPQIQEYLNTISKKNLAAPSPNWTNSTQMLKELPLGASMTVLAYNSFYKGRWEVMKIPVWSTDISVTCLGAPVESQILSNWESGEDVAPYTLFISGNVYIPPAGYITCTLKRASTFTPPPAIPTKKSGTISNGFISLTISDGIYSEVTLSNDKKSKSVPLPFIQRLREYTSYAGPGQASGAYIFRPVGDAQNFGPLNTTIRETPVVKEVHQTWSNYASQTTRLYNDRNGAYAYMEVTYRLGPLPGNRELISHWETGIATKKGDLYTDDNGWATNRRQFDTNATLSIPANYYPSVYASHIQPSNKDGVADGIYFGILSDRSHGVSSLDEGTIEAMMHRRLLQDDHRGVVEPLNDTSIITTQQRLVFGFDLTDGSTKRAHHSLELNYPLAIYYSNVKNFETSYFTSFNTSQGLKHGIHVISARLLRPDSRTILVRLANVFSVPEGGQIIPVDLKQIFNAPICRFQETSLTGMIVYRDSISNPIVDFKPRDIKTFLFFPC